MAEYYVVEFRFPIQIDDASSVKDAALKAAKECEKRYGFFPSGWFARVFEYDGISIGPSAEWFSNPSGTTFRKLDQNLGGEVEDN